MTQVPFRLTQRILLLTRHQVTKKLGAAHMKSILSVTASQAMSLMIGTGLNANSKRSLCSPKTGIVFRSGLHRLRKSKLTISATRKRLKGQSDDGADDFTKGNEPSPILATRKVHLANRGPDAGPWHFCLRVQQGSGNNSDVSTRGRSDHGRNTQCPHVWRMGGDLGRLCQRRDPPPSLRLHHQAKLHRRFACPQRPGAVRNRSKALSGNARSSQRRPCTSASATWQKHP